jgi:hypothetical protein
VVIEYVFGLSWLFYFVLGIGLARTHFFNTHWICLVQPTK